jgi:hypothetical protein
MKLTVTVEKDGRVLELEVPVVKDLATDMRLAADALSQNLEGLSEDAA